MQAAVEADPMNVMEWRHLTLKVRSDLGIPADARPFQSRRQTRLVASMSARQRDVLDVAEAVRLYRRIPLAGFYCDISQCVTSKPWGSLGVLCTSSVVYDFEHDCMLSELGMLAAQGYPVAERFRYLQDCYLPLTNTTLNPHRAFAITVE